MRKFVLIEYENWPFPLWENADEMEELEASWRFKEAYTLYKESKLQGGARRESTPEVEVVDLIDEDKTSEETSVFHNEVHPLQGCRIVESAWQPKFCAWQSA